MHVQASEAMTEHLVRVYNERTAERSSGFGEQSAMRPLLSPRNNAADREYLIFLPSAGTWA
jgi:hypothetical protein